MLAYFLCRDKLYSVFGKNIDEIFDILHGKVNIFQNFQKNRMIISRLKLMKIMKSLKLIMTYKKKW